MWDIRGTGESYLRSPLSWGFVGNPRLDALGVGSSSPHSPLALPETPPAPPPLLCRKLLLGGPGCGFSPPPSPHSTTCFAGRSCLVEGSSSAHSTPSILRSLEEALHHCKPFRRLLGEVGESHNRTAQEVLPLSGDFSG